MTPAEAHTQLLTDLRAAGVSENKLAIWIEPGSAIEIVDNRLVLAFPHLNCGWVQRRYAGMLGDAARKQGLAGVRIVEGKS